MTLTFLSLINIKMPHTTKNDDAGRYDRYKRNAIVKPHLRLIDGEHLLEPEVFTITEVCNGESIGFAQFMN